MPGPNSVMPKPCFELDLLLAGVFFYQRHGQRCAAAGAKTEGGENGRFPILSLRQQLIHRRHARKHSHLLPLNQIQHLRRIKLAQQNNRAAQE